MSTIKTKRLILRPFTESDAEAALRNSNQPTVSHFLSDMVLKTAEEAREWIRWLETIARSGEPFQVLAIERREDQQVIGLVGVAPKKELGGEVEILFAVADGYQNCGYATEAAKGLIWWAFEEADQDVLSAIVKPENAPSRRVIEKLGFVYCDTRTLPYDGENCVFDYFRLYHLDELPGPDWEEDTGYTPERMDEFFDVRADGYNEHMLGEGSKASYERFGSFLPKTEETLEILDLGCGTGIELRYIWEQAPKAHITCMDVSEGMLDILVRTYPGREGQLTVIKDSYLTWSYPPEAFDIVVSCNTMHHLWEAEKTEVYRKIRQTLKPSGWYLEDDFMVNKAMAEQYRRRYHVFSEALGDKAKIGEYHIDIPFTIDTQKQLLADAGYRSVEVLYDCIRLRGSGAILRAQK